jgi:hypothetical protein
MKVIVAGSRTIVSYGEVRRAIKTSPFHITEIVSGGAKGVDSCGETWALHESIPLKRFPADWLKYGKAAGPIRNRAMAKYADALIAVWDGLSRGTQDMILQSARMGLPVYIVPVTGGDVDD